MAVAMAATHAMMVATMAVAMAAVVMIMVMVMVMVIAAERSRSSLLHKFYMLPRYENLMCL